MFTVIQLQETNSDDLFSRLYTFTNLGITFVKKPFKMTEDDHTAYAEILEPFDYSFHKFNIKQPDFFRSPESDKEASTFRLEMNSFKAQDQNKFLVDFNILLNESINHSHPYIKIQIIGFAKLDFTSRQAKIDTVKTVNAWINKDGNETPIEQWFTDKYPQPCFKDMFDAQTFANSIALKAFESESIHEALSSKIFL